MKRLLATSIALSALGALPVVAETGEPSIVSNGKPSVWLILSVDDGMNYSSFEKVEMKDMNQCEEQGAVYLSSKKIGRRHNEKGFVCLEGK